MQSDSPAMRQGKPLNVDNYIIATRAFRKDSTAAFYHARRRAEAGHNSDPTEIALKAMPDVDKFCAEVSVLSSLSQDPNLVGFYGVCLMDRHTEEHDDDSDDDDYEAYADPSLLCLG